MAGAVAGMAASLEGIDALVFTAGTGERSLEIRERGVRELRFLGFEPATAANTAARVDELFGQRRVASRLVVVAAREELVIARAVRALVAEASG